MKQLSFECLPLQGLKLINRQLLADNRGVFSRVFCSEELSAAGWKEPIAQLNYSFTATKGTIRGLHFQLPPYSDIKLVSCIRGSVFDVAVDLRKDSATYLQWHGENLGCDNGKALLIPEGFAHGFQSLEDNVEIIYCHSKPYKPEFESGISPLDSTLHVAWPLAVTKISDRDLRLQCLNSSFPGVKI